MGNVSAKSQIVIGYTQESDEKEQELSVKKSILKKFTLNLSGKSILSLQPSLHLGSSLRVIDLSNNYLKEIPDAFYDTPFLISLDVSNNRLETLPPSLSSLENLIELKANRNNFSTFPQVLTEMVSLLRLNLSMNKLTLLPSEISNMVALTTLILDQNPINYFPIEINLIQALRDLSLEGCPLLPEGSDPSTSQNTVFSLKELAARAVVSNNIDLTQEIPRYLEEFIKSYRKCSTCSGPFFQEHLQTFRFVYKWGYAVPCVYNLCKAHWKTDRQRVFEMFNPRTSNKPKFICSSKSHCKIERCKSGSKIDSSKSSSQVEMRKSLSETFANRSAHY